jgi:hypothetical protein
MAYQIKGALTDGRPFTISAEALGEAKDLAKKSIRDGDCQSVDIFDPALSTTTPVVTDEQLRRE